MAQTKGNTSVKKAEEKLPVNYGDAVAGGVATGFEEATGRDDYALPIFTILQAGSPQIENEVEGAKVGRIVNTATDECFDSLLFVPCQYQRRFVEWVPRTKGGGFVEVYMPDDPVVKTAKTNEDNTDMLPNGNELMDTRYFYGMVLDEEGGYSPAVIPMTSTQLKKAKKFMSLMQGIKVTIGGRKVTPPMASQVYELTTQPEENDKGKWRGWVIKHHSEVSDQDLFDAAMAFRDTIIAGDAKIDHNQERQQASAGDTGKSGGDVPF